MSFSSGPAEMTMKETQDSRGGLSDGLPDYQSSLASLSSYQRGNDDKGRCGHDANGPDNMDAIVINYIFVDPEIPHDTPLPIFLSPLAMERPAAQCRLLFAHDLAAELDVQVDRGKLRFWKPRSPVTVDVPSGSGEWTAARVDAAEFAEAFALVPLTRSLRQVLSDSMGDSDLIHLVVTSNPLYNQPAPRSAPAKAKAEPGPGLRSHDDSGTVSVKIGSFTTDNAGRGRSWRYITPGERHAQDMVIPTRTSIPSILLGIRGIDIGTFSNGMNQHSDIELATSVSNITGSSFRLHMDSWGRTKLFDAQLDWLVADPSPLFQMGSVDSQFFRADNGVSKGGATIQRIVFRHAFAAPPKVFVCLGGFTLGPGTQAVNATRSNLVGKYWDVRCFASDVDSRGFTLNIVSTKEDDGALGNGQVHWLAFPEGGLPGRLQMECGEFRTTAETSSSVKGHTAFATPFRNGSSPRMFVALNHFTSDRASNIRIRVKIANVKAAGMDWEIVTWGFTKLARAAVSYIAVENTWLYRAAV